MLLRVLRCVLNACEEPEKILQSQKRNTRHNRPENAAPKLVIIHKDEGNSGNSSEADLILFLP
jgi:hypothetical protein